MEDRIRKATELTQALKRDAPKAFLPPSEGTRPETHQIIPFAMIKGSRGYLDKVAIQINGCYEKGWYDGCAVMMRRLLETLIIEVFEHHKLDGKIKNGSGDFYYFRDLIDAIAKEPSWNLSRNTKLALPRLKLLGDQSAHSRRYNAHREDIEKVSNDFRTVSQELLFLSGLK